MPAKTLKLAIFDIDGTLRRIKDPWVHLHHHLGVAEQAAGFLDRWQHGEISYEEWAQLDAALWRGFPRRAIESALETYPFRDGARELVGWFTTRAIPCVGISTGLSIFNDITARELNFTEIISNDLKFDHGVCNGQISVRVREDNKATVMDEVLTRYRINPERVVAFGDGSADIPLLSRAGLGIAVFPSNERVRTSADAEINVEPIDQAIELVAQHFDILT
jgi:phosphoserine phosphatase